MKAVGYYAPGPIDRPDSLVDSLDVSGPWGFLAGMDAPLSALSMSFPQSARRLRVPPAESSGEATWVDIPSSGDVIDLRRWGRRWTIGASDASEVLEPQVLSGVRVELR